MDNLNKNFYTHVLIAIGVLVVESNQLQTDCHGSDVMARELYNIILLNAFFNGARTQESELLATTPILVYILYIIYNSSNIYFFKF